MNFKEYCNLISKSKFDLGFVSDFATDVSKDIKFPESIMSTDELESYLLLNGACDAACQGANQLMLSYLTMLGILNKEIKESTAGYEDYLANKAH